jgi:general stress protein 26
MPVQAEQDHDIKKIAELIKEIDFGMLTTECDDGTLRSRPMSANGHVEANGDVYFFTYGASHKVSEAKTHPQVNVAFSDVKNNKYLSLSGTAQLVRDKEKIKELWKPQLKAWFPQGVDTPDIALLKVSATKAEYWDMPTSLVAHTIAFVSSLTGNKPEIGENKKVELK